MKSLFAGALLALAACTALPAAASPTKQQIDASMLLSGSITVSPAGSVQSYTINQADKVPQVVMQLLAKTIPQWRFQPVLQKGQPVTAKAPMHVRVMATPRGNKRYDVTVAGATFGDPAHNSDNDIHVAHRIQPTYPRNAVEERVSGTVYLLLRVDRQGSVDKIAAQKVNLRILGPEVAMKRWRRMLADAAMRSIKQWTFAVPTTGPEAAKDHWLVRVPVTYNLRGWNLPPIPGYGEWRAYVPGPEQAIPWAQSRKRATASIDAMPDNGVRLAGSGLQRIAPPHS